MNKFIFLDFDGVLHPVNGKKFSCLDFFSEVISDFSFVKIVFSTSWREYSDFNKLTNMMPKRIQDKCFGITPVIANNISHPRYHEILLFNDNNNIFMPDWIALDDMDCLFPKNCDNLILTESNKGFNQEIAQKLIVKLNHNLKCKNKI